MTEEKNEKASYKIGDIIHIENIGDAEITEITIDNEESFIGFKCKLKSK